MGSDFLTGADVKRLIGGYVKAATAVLLCLMPVLGDAAEDAVCARVKIEIVQELTLERQGFDAQMKIHNTLEGVDLTDVAVQVNFMDENGLVVLASSDPGDTNARFFIQISNQENISNVSGTGTVQGGTIATINWLIIPAPGAAGTTSFGKKYLVGATLTYKMGAEPQTVEVTPDVITVKPMPLLGLDYFLTRDVEGDDPLTAPIEPIVPFTLGVRVKNTGLAPAKSLKIDSAQPKIIENNQGLLINFQLTGSSLNDLPAENTLLLNFGDIAPSTAKMGRWIMESSLSGKFTEFTARFSHADELGGTLTSLIQSVNPHFLLRDVRVDAAGRDILRDFLAEDADGSLKVYESDTTDSPVQNISAQASLTSGGSNNGIATYQLSAPSIGGFFFIKKPDPFNGTQALGSITRSDNKVMAPENVWLSRTRNKDTKEWEYWVNFFDFNSPGVYRMEFIAPPAVATAPQMDFVADRTIKEGERTSFVVQASGMTGAPSLTAAPLPTGATFIAESQLNALTSSIFDWTPATGQAGNYLIVYTASHNGLSSTRSARITVESNDPPPGPGVPGLESPQLDEQVAVLKPALIVRNSTQLRDPTTQIVFELYSDEAMQQQVATASIAKGTTTTSWTVPQALNDNTRYWWRARAFNGTDMYSAWMDGRFILNQFNDAPEEFALLSPGISEEVKLPSPLLKWQNSMDADGDAITYKVSVFGDAALTQRLTGAEGLQPSAEGSTSWLVDVPLQDNVRYYWQVEAQDALGAITRPPAQSFLVSLNIPPTAPTIVVPQLGNRVTTTSVTLQANIATDVENNPLQYFFELDKVNTFDSSAYRASASLQTTSTTVSWPQTGLSDNTRYYWRVRAFDGRAYSDYSLGEFFVNRANDKPSLPVIANPGPDSWVNTLTPILSVHPATDVDGDAVSYHYQLSASTGFTTPLFERLATETQVMLDPALTDHKTYYWRVRAEDGLGGYSAWSPTAKFYVSSTAYVEPTLAFTAPSGIKFASTTKQFALRWQATVPNVDALVSLYYDTTGSGFVGTPIVEGRRQAFGTTSGGYTWNMSALPSGTYYVYGVIYDPRGASRAYAPGTVIIRPENQTGRVELALTGASATTTELAGKTTLSAALNQAPTADVKVGVSSSNTREGIVSPASLTFTANNWSIPQTITVTGREDCMVDGNQSYDIKIGAAVTVDPEFYQVPGPLMTLTNLDNETAPSADNPDFGVCALRVVAKRNMGGGWYEHDITVALTNAGPAVTSVTLTPLNPPANWTLLTPNLVFGAVKTNTTLRSTARLTVRAQASTLVLPTDMQWHVEVQP